jgi:arylsulfate sulfotransferase
MKEYPMAMTNPTVCLIGLLAGLCVPASATVGIISMKPSVKSPQPIGTSISFTVVASDTASGPLAFQFNVTPPRGPLTLAKDFNVGTSSSDNWISQPFVWVPTGVEGTYKIEVVIKDFTSGQTSSKTDSFQITPLVTGDSPVVVPTANPLVALFSAPSCASGSSMRIHFQQHGKTAFTDTSTVKCHPPDSMTFEIAGMYPSTAYQMVAQTITAGKVTNGTTLSFTTGALPTTIPFPTFTVKVPAGPETYSTDAVILHGLTAFGPGDHYPDAATDLSGKIIWYYYANNTAHYNLLTRPLSNGTFLAIQNGAAWNPATENQQLLRQIDLAGNVIRETNTGALQQELLAMGVADATPCNLVPSPPPIGAACLNAFHHDAIQTLPNGYTAALVSVEKIYPPGTQGDTSGLPVDILGDMILVLNANWQVVWYFDAFQHATGAPQLDITRASVLPNTCIANQSGCPPMFLLGPGISPKGQDWLHGNALYYWPTDSAGGASGDIIWSSKNQDWVMKLDYNNGSGTGNILWRMGPCGDFTFNNNYNDPWPWFSAQHEVAMENNGAGPLSLFDNGDTRVSPPTGAGSSTGCLPGVGSGDSRGMAVTFNESNMQVTPVLSDDLGVFSTAGGSAQLLPDGNYFFLPAVVVVSLSSENSFSIEVLPTAGTDSATQVLNISGPTGYRGWQMPSLYTPPTT